MARLEPEARRQKIIEAAIVVAEEGSYSRLSRSDVALLAQCAPTLVTHYFGHSSNLSEVVMREAIKRRNLPIIAQGLVANDPLAMGAAQDLREAAARSMVEG